MQTFKRITVRFLNHVLQCKFQETYANQKQEDSLFKFTSIPNSQIFDDWIKRKFNEFICESFYQGIQLDSSSKQSKQHEKNSKIWEIYDLEQNSQKNLSKIEIQSKGRNNKLKIDLDQIQKFLREEYPKKFEKSENQQKKSSMLRLYFPSINDSQNSFSSYLVNWKQKDQVWNGEMKPSITLVNPCLGIFQQMQNQYEKVCHSHPQCIILTSSSLITLLSTISLTHLIFYWHQQKVESFQLNSKSKEVIKIITTKLIYQKYLELFKFLRLISSFVQTEHDLVHSLQKQHKNSPHMHDMMNELNLKYSTYLQSNSQVIKNKLHYMLSNYHFHIVNPEEHFTFNQVQFCIRNHNIFPYQTYDLEIYDPTDGKFLALIEEQNLNNVKNIYYTHKKGFINQDLYLKIIQRFDQKQNLLKNNTDLVVFKCNDCTSVLKQIDLSPIENKKFIKKTCLLIDVKKKIQTSTQLLYNDPYTIPIEQKNQIFAKMRKIKDFALLSDIDIQSMINESVLLQLNQNQVIYNPTMKFQYLFVVLDGVCRLQQKSEFSIKLISSRDIFGWKYFLTDSKRSLENQKCDEKETLLTVHSFRATVLRIQLDFLSYLLFDKIDLLKNSRKTNIFQLLDQQSQKDNPFSREIQKRFETFRQLCSQTNLYQINVIQGIQNNSLRVLIANNPNMALII